jgi:hypothetical protein
MTRDRYAGDAAWQQWFERCQVPLCNVEFKSALSDEIVSAMRRATQKKDCKERYADDYMVARFDEHFKLGGSFVKPKPLKQYLLGRVKSARHGLKGIVLGTIFAGEMKTIAREMKRLEDGTITRWVTRNGQKTLQIATSFDAEISRGDGEDGSQEGVTLLDKDIRSDVDVSCTWASVSAATPDPDCDSRWFRAKALEFLSLLKKNNKSEKIISSAAMVYAMANKISPTRPVVQRLLGVKQGGAAKKIHQMEENLKRFCKAKDIRFDGAEFVRALLRVSAAVLKKEGVLEELEASK